MRAYTGLFVAFLLVTLAARADGLLYRLPEDGTFARYSFRQTMGLQNKKPIAVEGTLTLACVGKEKVNDEEGRWIEIIVEAKSPEGGRTLTRGVFKALIPEKRLGSVDDRRSL